MDDFSDDGFDELNVALLQELENNALESLQSQKSLQKRNAGIDSLHRGPRPAGGPAVIHIDDDFDAIEEEALLELARVPVQHPFTGRLAAAAAPPPLPLPAYSQRSVADVPLPATNNRPNYDKPGSYLYRASGRPQPQPGQSSVAIGAGRPQVTTTTTTTTATAAGIRRPPPMTASQAAVPTSENTTIAALQARVRTLETDLYTARGQASIVQNKYENFQRQYEADLTRVQKQKEEELVRQRERAEAAVAAQEIAITELRFARQELKEQTERSKKGRRNDRAEVGGVPTTPRKGAAGRSNWEVADGFDDIERLPSPSKGASRRLKEVGIVGGSSAIPALERTPTKGSKRRRPPTDSPTKPLETLVVDAAVSSPLQVDTAAGPDDPPPPQPSEEAPFSFLQEVLGHQIHPGGPSTIELFSRYSFPSNRKQTLAFLMLQRIPKLEGTQGTTRLMLDFCQLLLGIWSQCFREQYFPPLPALVSLLSYVLLRDLTGLAPHILQTLLPLAQATVYLVAEPAFNNPSLSLASHPDFTVRQLAGDIDAGAIMSLLRLIALGCLSPSAQQQPRPSQDSLYPDLSIPAQTLFWSLIEFEFVLLMLSSKQPQDAFLGMLALLRTSALPDSIGPITNDPNKDASVVASTLIDRISHHMEEPPKWATSSKHTEWDMRLSALGVLDCFSQSPFGKLSLAASDSTLPRLLDIFFPAYGELRDRDVLREPLYPAVGEPPSTEARLRAYGIGGFDLVQTLGPKPDAETKEIKEAKETKKARDGSLGTASATTGNQMDRPETDNDGSGDVNGSGNGNKDDPTKNDSTPLILLYISSVVDLVHSIVTDPFTSAVANIPAKLAETRCGTQSIYLLMMARLGFRADPVLAYGLRDETYRLALELFNLAATPEEQKDYAEWAGDAQEAIGGGAPDPFAYYVPEKKDEAAETERMVP